MAKGRTIDINLKVKPNSTIKHMVAMRRRAAKGFKKEFEWTHRRLEEQMEKRFETNAYGTWKPVSPRTAKWKIEDGYGAQGVLVRTEALKNSLTVENARGAIREIGLFRMKFGTDIPYAKFHQYGDGVPKRVLIPQFDGVTSLFPRSLMVTVGAICMERIIYGYANVGHVYKFVKKTGIRGSAASQIKWLSSGKTPGGHKKDNRSNYIDGGKLTEDR